MGGGRGEGGGEEYFQLGIYVTRVFWRTQECHMVKFS